MSLAEIVGSIRDKLLDEEALETSGNCRTTAEVLLEEVRRIDPDVDVRILAAHPGDRGVNNHYALLVVERDRRFVVNPVAAAGYPQYIGDADLAPPTFSSMTEVDVIV